MTPATTFAGRRVAVFGLARSGIVSAEALRAGGAEVACWDDGEAGRDAASKAGLPLADLATADWSQFAALVLAPGVPLTHPRPHWTVEKATAAGIEIIGDIELFFRERAKIAPGSPVVAITGTNGKSTTTALIAHLLRELGHDVQMGGNIGVSVLALAPPAPERFHVIEMSSFQIDTTPTLDPSVGVLLNITPDHLDRHGSLEIYAGVKARLVRDSGFKVIGIDDDNCRAVADASAMRGDAVARISAREPASVHWQDGRLIGGKLPADDTGQASQLVRLADLRGIASLRGAHNGQNAAAAVAALIGLFRQVRSPLGDLDALAPRLQAAFTTFPGLVHRMEQLGHVGRALLVNDSKATNADSTEKALLCFSGDLFWIVGGVQKEGGIAPLAHYFAKIAKAYLIGKSSPDFARALDGKVTYEQCGDLAAAITAAVRDANAGSAREPVVLLSPACASYDQYKSFEHRGDHFRTLARALPGFVPMSGAAPGAST